ncbi:MAG: serine/threonine-protein kinase [Kofleriaceae bacterium]
MRLESAFDETVPVSPNQEPVSDAGGAPSAGNDTQPTETHGAPRGSSSDINTHAEPRYRLGAVIGRGGMGEVVSARDEQIGRSVAIKRISALDAPEATIARFLREARIQGRLDHPAIVPVHELRYDDSQRPYFVMKQLTGVTLADALRRLASGDRDAERRFSRHHLLRAFVDVCLAIEFAHTRGVVHRDLKPANIMLGEFGEVYVLDWGIARLIGDGPHHVFSADLDPSDTGQTLAGSMLGTPGYMASEQINSDADIDGRADVYSLGCILFEILAGQPLHSRGESVLAGLQGRTDARPSSRAPDRGIAPELDAVCVTATQVARDHRFATARDLGDAVQRYLDGDRDVATRSKLAAAELAVANAALARGTSANDRRAAIRASARALALDPSSGEAAELVGKLMLEPPTDVPPEVAREIEELDDEALRTHARNAGLAPLGYLAFFPLLFAGGFRELWYLIGGPALAIGLVVVTRALSRGPSNLPTWVGIAGNALMISLFAFMLTPFLVAPVLAIGTVMVIAMQTRVGRGWVLWAIMTAAVLVPWLAEVVGITPTTTTYAGDQIILSPATSHVDPTLTTIGFVIYVIVVLGLATAMSRILAGNRVRMQRALHLQAWQLKQLVPRARTSAR